MFAALQENDQRIVAVLNDSTGRGRYGDPGVIEDKFLAGATKYGLHFSGPLFSPDRCESRL
jgi:hypothetical protein